MGLIAAYWVIWRAFKERHQIRAIQQSRHELSLRISSLAVTTAKLVFEAVDTRKIESGVT